MTIKIFLIQQMDLRLRNYKKKEDKACLPSFFASENFSQLFSAHAFVRNGEFFSPFCTTSGQHSATISGGHSFSETMFVFASSVGRLECSFHLISAFVSLFQYVYGLKKRDFWHLSKELAIKILKIVLISVLMGISILAIQKGINTLFGSWLSYCLFIKLVIFGFLVLFGLLCFFIFLLLHLLD